MLVVTTVATGKEEGTSFFFSKLEWLLRRGRGRSEVLEDTDEVVFRHEDDNDELMELLVSAAEVATRGDLTVGFSRGDDRLGGLPGRSNNVLQVALSPVPNLHLQEGDHLLLKMDRENLDWLSKVVRPQFDSRVYLLQSADNIQALVLLEAYFISEGVGEMTVRKVEEWSSGACMSCPFDIWSRRKDLQGQEVKVAIMEMSPYSIRQPGKMLRDSDGFSMDFWRIYQENFNITSRWRTRFTT